MPLCFPPIVYAFLSHPQCEAGVVCAGNVLNEPMFVLLPGCRSLAPWGMSEMWSGGPAHIPTSTVPEDCHLQKVL